METLKTAIETTGFVDAESVLHLDSPLPIKGPSRVRMILVVDDDDISDEDWLRALARNPAYDFLNDLAEDIYTIEDGKPFHHEG